MENRREFSRSRFTPALNAPLGPQAHPKQVFIFVQSHVSSRPRAFKFIKSRRYFFQNHAWPPNSPNTNVMFSMSRLDPDPAKLP